MAMGGLDPRRSAAENYRAFGREARGRSPAYESLAASVADDDLVLGFLAALPPPKRQPNLLFAAARYLLDAPPGLAALRALIRQNEAELTEVMLTRRTQTNEPARCATLLPALAALPGPLALIEVGASAGLTLLFDRYSYDYDGHLITGRDPDAPTLHCAVRGPAPLPARLPAIAWRAGLDLSPLDVTRDDDVRWLSCLVWPGESDRQARLAAAVASARRDPPPVYRGDLLTDLPAVAARRRPRPPSSFTIPRYWPMSRPRTGSGLPATSVAWAPCGCPTRLPASCLACRSLASGRGHSCSAATGGRRWLSPTVTGHGCAGWTARAAIHAQVPLQEAHLMPEQVLGDRLARGLVAGSGQQQHLVRPPGGQQRAGQAQRVRCEDVGVRQAVDSSSGLVSLGASRISERASYRSGNWSGWPRNRSRQYALYSRWSVTPAPATATWKTSGRCKTAHVASDPPNDQPRMPPVADPDPGAGARPPGPRSPDPAGPARIRRRGPLVPRRGRARACRSRPRPVPRSLARRATGHQAPPVQLRSDPLQARPAVRIGQDRKPALAGPVPGRQVQRRPQFPRPEHEPGRVNVEHRPFGQAGDGNGRLAGPRPGRRAPGSLRNPPARPAAGPRPEPTRTPAGRRARRSRCARRPRT